MQTLKPAHAGCRTFIVPHVRVIGEERLKSITTLVDKAIAKLNGLLFRSLGQKVVILILLFLAVLNYLFDLLAAVSVLVLCRKFGILCFWCWLGILCGKRGSTLSIRGAVLCRMWREPKTLCPSGWRRSGLNSRR